ncbi:MAG: type II secretion system F family protein [Planctomycetota bacterium]|nr:MAG: type II secretion system F family protein [Planctomycetota bacterium]
MAERTLTFSYTARDAAGGRRSGEVEALSEQEAIRLLRKEGLIVTDIRLGKAPLDAEAVLLKQAARRVKRDEVIDFSAQLSVMLDTGVPLADALHAYVAQTKSTHLKRIVELVTDRITSGVSFSGAIRQFPRVFPQIMVSLIQASEATGTLGSMLGRVSEHMGRERKTIKQIRGALTYPLFMVTMALGVSVFLITWVLPKFAKIYESRSAALPMPTQIVLGISTFVGEHGVALALGAAGLVTALAFFRRSEKGRATIDRLKIKAPIVGPIFTNFYLSRAASTLSELLGAGVSLPDALEIVAGVTDNTHWRRMWRDIDESIREGKTMSDVVMQSSLMPPSVAQIIAAGERTGKLPKVLDRVARIAQEEMDQAIKTGTQLIEPVMIVVMGALIGGIAIALLLPIFSISQIMTQ